MIFMPFMVKYFFTLKMNYLCVTVQGALIQNRKGFSYWICHRQTPTGTGIDLWLGAVCRLCRCLPVANPVGFPMGLFAGMYPAPP